MYRNDQLSYVKSIARGNNSREIPFKIASEKITFLRIKWTWAVWNLYEENVTILVKDTQADLNMLEDMPWSCVGGINIIKMPIISANL